MFNRAASSRHFKSHSSCSVVAVIESLGHLQQWLLDVMCQIHRIIDQGQQCYVISYIDIHNEWSLRKLDKRKDCLFNRCSPAEQKSQISWVTWFLYPGLGVQLLVLLGCMSLDKTPNPPSWRSRKYIKMKRELVNIVLIWAKPRFFFPNQSLWLCITKCDSSTTVCHWFGTQAAIGMVLYIQALFQETLP